MGWKRPLEFAASRRFVGLAGNIAVVIVALILLLLLAHFVFLLTDFSRDENIRDVGLALAAVIGFPVIVWRAVVHQRQADIAQENLTTDLINKAVEGLGAEKTVKRGGDEVTEPNLEVRIGAIYQLERIARIQAHLGTEQGAADHIRIMKILCAYVRENSNAQPPSESELGPWPEFPSAPKQSDLRERVKWRSERAEALKNWISTLPKPRTDIQTALEVLGSRDEVQFQVERADVRPGQEDGYRLDLRGANLQAAQLAHQDFRMADFTSARMEGAILIEARLEGVVLRETKLQGAVLSAAYLNGLDFDTVHLEGADLRKARMKRAVLRGIRMQSALLNEARLQETDFDSANLEGTVFSNAKMQGAMFSSSRMEATALIDAKAQGAEFQSTRLQGANLSGAQFKGADLSGAGLDGADLSATQMQGTDLRWTQLTGAKLCKVQMEGADFCGARLERVDLRWADLRSVNWTDSVIIGIAAHSTDFRGGLGLDQSRLMSLIGNAATLLPEMPDGRAKLFVPSCWTTDPPGSESRAAIYANRGLSKKRIRDPANGFFCAPGTVPMKTGTPWPVDRPPPWQQAGMPVEDWLALPENQPVEPVDPDAVPAASE